MSAVARSSRGRAAGFSLIELVATLTIAGMLAAFAIPSIAMLERTRSAAAADEVERVLSTARANAMMRGDPTGVEIITGAGTLRIVTIETAGDMPAAMLGPMGVASRIVDLDAMYDNVRITGVDTQSDDGAIWFGHDGTPMRRAIDGTLLGPATTDALVSLTDGQTVRARAVSGAIEVERTP